MVRWPQHRALGPGPGHELRVEADGVVAPGRPVGPHHRLIHERLLLNGFALDRIRCGLACLRSHHGSTTRGR